MRFRCFTLAKDEQYPNEDAFAECAAEGRFAISDGASTCYAGGAWAAVLARRFAVNPAFGPEWLLTARGEFKAEVMPHDDDILGVGAYERGNFATLLGFTVGDEAITGYAVGDTVLFVVEDRSLRYEPALESEDFARNPVLLSSHAGRGAFADDLAAFKAASFCIRSNRESWQGARLLAMTDALALAVLESDGEDRLSRLQEFASLPDQSAFATLVRTEIADGRLRFDDATLLIVEL